MTEELRQKIEAVLMTKIRPIIGRDGGDISIESLGEDGTLTLLYKGRCAGCPASEYTHGRIVEPAILGSVREVKRVQRKMDAGMGPAI